MRLLSSEAKDWKSRVETEAEDVLRRESAQVAHQATEAQEAMDQHHKAKWRQAEANVQALCQSNSAQAQSLASKLQETNLEHHELHTAQERQLRLEAQALRQAQEQEQQAAQLTHEHEIAIQEFRRQAEEQPELHKLLWRRQLSQQSTYKDEIHELYTEMLDMREKSETQSHCQHTCASWSRQVAQVYSLHPEFQGSLAQVLKLKNIVVLVHAVHLQLSGEVIVIENQEKKNVNDHCSICQ